MASAPKFKVGDSEGTTSLVLSTNQKAVVLEGTADANTIAIQVSVNGAPFVADPGLVRLDGPAFYIPNVAVYPNGLELQFGQNLILLRAIDIVGGVSATSSAQLTRVHASTQSDAVIPTGIRVRRKRGAVTLLVSARLPTDNPGFTEPLVFKGFNFYASTSPGGTSGRFRLNASPVTDVMTQEEEINEISASQAIFTPRGVLARTVVTLEDGFGEALDTVSDTVVAIANVATSLRFTTSLSSYELEDFVGFTHVRSATEFDGTINSEQFSDVEGSEPLYYTVTGLYYDPTQNLEFETPHSQEAVGAPIVIDTILRDLPGRSRIEILTDYVAAIQRVDQEISLVPGSTTRDVSIDPFSSEIERVWFIVDFVHRSGSFLTLLQIDDPNGDGVSDPVTGSSYKQALKAALGLQSDLAVQNLIDTQFDKLAGNFNKPRLSGRPAAGQVIFFTGLRPSRDLVIPSGAVVSTDADPDNGLPSTRYVVGGTFTLVAADADAYFNFDTQAYEITVDVTAEGIGSNGNRSAGQIKNIVSGVSGLRVTNREATRFGTTRESNSDLATRAQLGFVGIDSGTEGGYAATAAESIGIVKSKVVKSGDRLMMRDYDEVRRKHIGGKVDIWVQGLRERTVTEKFSFSFEVARDIRCEIADLSSLTFRVLDPRVTVHTPLGEVLNDVVQGFGVRNVTTGRDYNLVGVTIVDFETFRLSTTVSQPETKINDTITADYRFRSINQYTFALQPVRRVVSVSGQSSGPLDADLGYALYKTDDPLLTGESTIARDSLVINQVGGVPTGEAILVSDESHILIGFFEEPLQNVGINVASLRVYSEDRAIAYNGPLETAPDYDLVPGTSTSPLKLVRTNGSRIQSGETVVVDYVHDENFTVTYVINDLLQQLQQRIDTRRHLTADVLVKQAVQNSVALDTTVQLKQGASKDSVDPAVRTNVSIELNSKLIGQGTAQSDLINAIDSTDGVDFQVLPLARMGYADGARKLRVPVLSTSTRLGGLDVGNNRVFILTNALSYATIDGGGLPTEHKGVFEDDEPMTLSSSLSTVGTKARQAFIIGNGGAVIEGFTDDGTLAGRGFVDADDILTERRRLTANHVVISLDGSGTSADSPDRHHYAVSYVIRGDRGPHDIVPTAVEFIELGDFTLTMREAG